jgi:hypothetical protein
VGATNSAPSGNALLAAGERSRLASERLLGCRDSPPNRPLLLAHDFSDMTAAEDVGHSQVLNPACEPFSSHSVDVALQELNIVGRETFTVCKSVASLSRTSTARPRFRRKVTGVRTGCCLETLGSRTGSTGLQGRSRD